jgi:hypothetical protein
MIAVMQNLNHCLLTKILKNGVVRMKFHNESCDKSSYKPTSCDCGFIKEFLDPTLILERAKYAKTYTPQYKMLPDPNTKPLIDLSSLLAELREQARQSQPLNEENENE